MYTLEVKLNPKGYEAFLDKRFRNAFRLKKEVIKWFNRQEHLRTESEEYKILAKKQQAYSELEKQLKDEKDKAKKQELKEAKKALGSDLKKEWIELNNSYQLGSGKFVKYTQLGQATNMYQRFTADNDSVHWSTFNDIAMTVKQAYLKRRKQAESKNFLPSPRYFDFNTLWYRKCLNNITNTGVYFGKRKNKVFIPFKFEKDMEIRFLYALERQDLVQFALKRIAVHGKYKYSLLLVFEGIPYGVDKELENKGTVKIFLDVKKLAIKAVNAKNDTVRLFDLSNDFGYSEKLADLDRKIERSRRLSNPQNYNDNGTIKEGRLTWNYSNNYQKLRDKKRYLWHKITKSRKNRFGQIANELLLMGDEFVIYKKDFKSLQKRKDYNPEEMNWFDKRRQQGFEIMFNAPYEFLSILKIKLGYKEKELLEITE
ncbi:hypothetical protein GPZ88_10070 (plasmid) [Streptococcus ruminicola]|uniref:Uncharacterized protein n=1 Tax=Streptococcus ruminicola TaxID=2686210 RepID=A0A6G8I2M1_9STRE|nr:MULTISPECIES: hypothetical protein [Streptococcus]QGX47364.1 hypothetical protein GPA00_09525 [Streptococcus equinus]QIM47413.1 hypothetical protein GPZ88_10070 [Streptococcus ruminicola]